MNGRQPSVFAILPPNIDPVSLPETPACSGVSGVLFDTG